MKPITEMTEQELLDLIRLETTTLTLYYCSIASFNQDQKSVNYNGIDYGLDDETFKVLYDGKSRYELYKLSTSEAGIHAYVESKVSESISELFQAKFDTIQQSFNQALDSIQSLGASSDSVLKDLKSTSTAASKTISKLKDNLVALDTVKDEVKATLEPTREEFNKVVKKLQSLFK